MLPRLNLPLRHAQGLGKELEEKIAYICVVWESGSGSRYQSLKLSGPAVRFPIIAASITMVAPGSATVEQMLDFALRGLEVRRRKPPSGEIMTPASNHATTGEGKTSSIPSGLRKDWTVAEALALYALPFNDLLFQAQSIHRAHFDPNRVQLAAS